MQHLQVVGVTLDPERVKRQLRLAGPMRNVLAQPLRQWFAPALDTNQCRVSRGQESRGLARHCLQYVIQLVAVIQAHPLTCQ
nr:hypothetical protein GCM10020185_73310 [Pseudomonas brassicacearum subsp. brassicacearum]